MGFDLLVIGVSLGGIEALKTVLGGLGADFPVPVAVVQHRHRTSSDALVTLLQAHTSLRLCEPDDKEPMRPGTVYFAPAEYHLLAESGWFELSIGEPVCHSRPSVDVLFESAADALGAGVLGVILTGANADGAAGARCIRDAGGCVVVQDAATAASPRMPEAAIQAGVTDHVVPLDEIAPLLIQLCAPSEA